jgi:hypothetical protein
VPVRSALTKFRTLHSFGSTVGTTRSRPLRHQAFKTRVIVEHLALGLT